jgi:hypothetical protein
VLQRPICCCGKIATAGNKGKAPGHCLPSLQLLRAAGTARPQLNQDRILTWKDQAQPMLGSPVCLEL